MEGGREGGEEWQTMHTSFLAMLVSVDLSVGQLATLVQIKISRP